MEDLTIDNIKSRIPIVDLESIDQYDTDQMDHQWRLFTEHIRR